MNAKFNLEDYETVESRLEKFWVKFPEGKVVTQLENAPSGSWVVRAAIYANRDSDNPIATGHAHEVIGEGYINKTSALENCETSAIGRALANAGFATSGKRPSREEMTKVEKATKAKPESGFVNDVRPIEEVIAECAAAGSQDALRRLWNMNKARLDQVVDEATGQTLRGYITQIKDTL